MISNVREGFQTLITNKAREDAKAFSCSSILFKTNGRGALQAFFLAKPERDYKHSFPNKCQRVFKHSFPNK